jgi:hypothetical protein
MKHIYYLDSQGVINAFEENIEKKLLEIFIKKRGLIKATEAQVEAILNPKPSPEQLAAAARAERETRFVALDKLTVTLRWRDYTEAEKSALQAYRQALRDITKAPDFPEKIDWPELPKITS